MLPGCGSDSETTTKDAGIDAAKDVKVTTDTNNTGLDTSGLDQAVQIDAPSVDAIPIDSSSVDLALDLGITVDARRGSRQRKQYRRGALPACASLVNPLYIMSGDTQVPVLKTLGKALRQSANPVTLFGTRRVPARLLMPLQRNPVETGPILHPRRCHLGSQHWRGADLRLGKCWHAWTSASQSSSPTPAQRRHLQLISSRSRAQCSRCFL